jgi:hypothetical protein
MKVLTMSEQTNAVMEVLCFNFPDGTTYWCERDSHDAEKVVKAWKDRLTPEERQLYLCPGVFGGFVVMRMPRSAYQRIPTTTSSHALFAASLSPSTGGTNG